MAEYSSIQVFLNTSSELHGRRLIFLSMHSSLSETKKKKWKKCEIAVLAYVNQSESNRQNANHAFFEKFDKLMTCKHLAFISCELHAAFPHLSLVSWIPLLRPTPASTRQVTNGDHWMPRLARPG